MEPSVERTAGAGQNPLIRLVEEHRQYSRKLDVMLSHPYLSESEQQEAARLKKLKLKLKDEMERYARTATIHRGIA
jgi:uncharacterized protein YdcH (DUF465 family)